MRCDSTPTLQPTDKPSSLLLTQPADPSSLQSASQCENFCFYVFLLTFQTLNVSSLDNFIRRNLGQSGNIAVNSWRIPRLRNVESIFAPRQNLNCLG